MKGLTNFITERDWQETITEWYVWVDDAYQAIIGKGRLRKRGPEPDVSDSEIITMGLIVETWFQGHEEVGYAYIRYHLNDLFPRQLDLARFNVRRRDLCGMTEQIRRFYRDKQLSEANRFRIVDSAPVTLMTYTRGSRCQSVRDVTYFGVVSSKKEKFYGLRLHATVTEGQLIDEWMLAPASIPDGQAVDALLEGCSDLQVTGDKAYNDQDLEKRLWDKRRILLMPLRKKNMKAQWAEGVQKMLGKVRHRVETVFSTISTVFNIQRPRGRSLVGHAVRITTCILAHTLCFVSNQS